MEKTVYTVGHSNRTLNEFIDILKAYNINIVVDVRRFPVSSRYPWFNKDSLCQSLKSKGVRYVWMGNLLGGYRTGGYKKYLESKEYERGIKKLISLIEREKGYVAIMCSEMLWFKCHRRYIADTLSSKGFKVVHVISMERTYTHKVKN